jgi:hypothetical protein
VGRITRNALYLKRTARRKDLHLSTFRRRSFSMTGPVREEWYKAAISARKAGHRMVLHLATVTVFCRRLTIARISPSTSLIVGNQPPQHPLSSSRRTISSRALQMANEPLTLGATLCSQSGRTYTIQEVLAEQRVPLLCVYRARYDTNPILSSSDATLIIRTADGQNFIVKNMIPGEYKYQQDLQKRLASCPNLRTVVDGLPGPELFIYQFLETDFLQFSQKNLTKATRTVCQMNRVK